MRSQPARIASSNSESAPGEAGRPGKYTHAAVQRAGPSPGPGQDRTCMRAGPGPPICFSPETVHTQNRNDSHLKTQAEKRGPSRAAFQAGPLFRVVRVGEDAAGDHGGAGEDEGDTVARGRAGADKVEVGEGRVPVGRPEGHELPQRVAQPEGRPPAGHVCVRVYVCVSVRACVRVRVRAPFDRER